MPNTLIDAFDHASLDALRLDLRAVGFEAVTGGSGRDWIGPLPLEMWDLTEQREMRVSIRDGWPFLHPHVFVPGVSGEHVSDTGLVCLWNDDDVSLEWLSWGGIRERLLAWGERARGGFEPADAGLDAFMAFSGRAGALATFDVNELAGRQLVDGQSGQMHGVWLNDGRLDLRPGRPTATGEHPGLWFYRKKVLRPPRNVNELTASLSARQRRALFRATERDAGSAEAPIDFAVLMWPRFGSLDVLAMTFVDQDGARYVRILEPAPRDEITMKTRAGPDASELSTKIVAVFGLGAVGSHIALLLAEDGVGDLRLIDDDRLRPGNVVRHVAGNDSIGELKVAAVKSAIAHHVSQAKVTTHSRARPYGPTEIRQAVGHADLIIDATGHASFSAGIARLARADGLPLIAATLFRNGAIARVSRQTPTDPPLFERGRQNGFPQVPADPANDARVLETGCSAPVNLAPPSSVMSVAALASRMAVDALMGRLEYPSEVLETYRCINEAPFDRVGQIKR